MATYPNKYAGPCGICEQRVAAGVGVREVVDGKWTTFHTACREAAAGYAKASTFTPTAEQVKALDAFRTGRPMVIEAGAGTGKTSTLRYLAEDAKARGLRGQYVAFNKAIVTDAAGSMPGNVTCNTMHSLAFRAIGKRFAHRLDSARMRSDQIARILGVDPFIISYGKERKVLQPRQLGGLVMRAVSAFCASVDIEPTEDHIPYVDGIDLPNADGSRTFDNNRQLRRHLIAAVRKAWSDLSDPKGQLPYRPDAYLKLWSMSNPRIDADIIFFDEGQDADPVQLQIVLAQEHAQLVIVGDSQQAIYGWRGAVDALAQVRERGGHVVYLTQSFRFGPAVADVANGILGRFGAELRLVGTDAIASVVAEVNEPDAILTRTNAKAVTVVLETLKAGRRPALVGGAAEVVSFAKAARDLQDGSPTDHRDLSCFDDWGQVLDYVKTDAQGEELRLLVKLIEDFGVDGIIDGLSGAVPEDKADVVVSTAHKSKGRQWTSVQLAADFAAPRDGGDLSPDELRLLYVAVTRARRELDVSQAPIALGAPDEAADLTVDVESALDLTARYGTTQGGTR